MRGRLRPPCISGPLTQGRLALQALYEFLLNGIQPPARLRAVPYLVMRSNLDLMLLAAYSLTIARHVSRRGHRADGPPGAPSDACPRGRAAIALTSTRRASGEPRWMNSGLAGH